MATKDFLEQHLMHEFTNDKIVHEALDATGLNLRQSNTRLAILGDTVMKTVLMRNWYSTDTPRVQATRILERVGSNGNLARVGRVIGIEKHINMHPGHIGPVSNKTIATAVEAVLGAVFVDSGHSLAAVEAAMENIGLVPN